MKRLVPGLVVVAALVAAALPSGPAVALSAATQAPVAASAAGAPPPAVPTPAALAAAAPTVPPPATEGSGEPDQAGTAAAADLASLWRDACLWEVGSNKEKVPEARRALIAEGERTLDYLIPAKLDTKDTLITRALQVVLTGIGKSAVPRLLPCLDSPSASVRRNAADLLGALGAVESAPAIARLLSDPDARLGALAALAALKSPAAVPEVAALLTSGAPERVRVQAAATLGAIGGGAAIAALAGAARRARGPRPLRRAVRPRAAQGGGRAEGEARGAGRGPARAAPRDRRPRAHRRPGARAATCGPLLDDPSPVVRGFASRPWAPWRRGPTRAEFRRRLPAETDPFVRGKLEEALASRPPQ